MILADKIINLRKKAGLSQEELAYKLNVSRQSVSKWEGALSVPEINKIIEMAKIFGVSTDYLLKDEIEDIEYTDDEPIDENAPRKVSMKEALGYLDTIQKERFKIAIGVVLCVTCPALLILLSGLSDLGYVGETLASVLGIIYLFVSVSIAVGLFIIGSTKIYQYAYLKNEIIDTEYGITGLVKEKQKENHDSYIRSNVYGTILCILSVVPLIVFSILDYEFYTILSICLMLIMVASACFIFIVKGLTVSSFKCLLQEKEYSRKEKKFESSVYGAIIGSFWTIIAAIYLLISFLTGAWRFTWIIFVVASAIHPFLKAILRSRQNKSKK